MTDFTGFPIPESNFSRLPHAFIDLLPLITTIAEMKVILYIIRHTWGFSEYDEPKKLTVEDFMHGRKNADGERLDKGTGLTKPSVIAGLREAEAHGIVSITADESDAARVKKYYCLKMEGSKVFTPEVKSLDIGGKNSLPRSEKETIERKEKTPAPENGAVPDLKVLKPENPKRERKPDPIFDAVALHIFGIQDANSEGGRIAKISNWLAGKYAGKGVERVGKISNPVEVQHIQQFAEYCKQRGINPPLDFVKFVENWRKWASALKQKSQAPAWQPATAPPEPATPALSAAERSAMLEEMRQRKGQLLQHMSIDSELEEAG